MKKRLPEIRTWKFALVILIMTFCGCKVIEKQYPLESSMKDFNSKESRLANSGYMELFRAEAKAIPLLFGNLDSTEVFYGNIYQDPKYSFIPPKASKGLVSLYLIEAIRLDNYRPHSTPMIISLSGDIPPDGFEKAKGAYRSWWDALPEKTIKAVRGGPDPLAGTGLEWK